MHRGAGHVRKKVVEAVLNPGGAETGKERFRNTFQKEQNAGSLGGKEGGNKKRISVAEVGRLKDKRKGWCP